jgi:hypothetical protein
VPYVHSSRMTNCTLVISSSASSSGHLFPCGMPINNPQNRLLRSRGPKYVEGLVHLERVCVARSLQLGSAQGWISHRVLLAGAYNFAGSQQFLQPECIIDCQPYFSTSCRGSTSTCIQSDLTVWVLFRFSPRGRPVSVLTNLQAELNDMSIVNLTLVRSRASWSARGLVGLVGPELARLPLC